MKRIIIALLCITTFGTTTASAQTFTTAEINNQYSALTAALEQSPAGIKDSLDAWGYTLDTIEVFDMAPSIKFALNIVQFMASSKPHAIVSIREGNPVKKEFQNHRSQISEMDLKMYKHIYTKTVGSSSYRILFIVRRDTMHNISLTVKSPDAAALYDMAKLATATNTQLIQLMHSAAYEAKLVGKKKQKCDSHANFRQALATNTYDDIKRCEERYGAFKELQHIRLKYTNGKYDQKHPTDNNVSTLILDADY